MSLSKTEQDKYLAEWTPFGESIRKSGNFISANALESTQNATTVRVRNGRTQVTDGPFAETKEQLGGYYLIEATDLNQAIQIASRIPAAKHGCIEVRPIRLEQES